MLGGEEWMGLLFMNFILISILLGILDGFWIQLFNMTEWMWISLLRLWFYRLILNFIHTGGMVASTISFKRGCGLLLWVETRSISVMILFISTCYESIDIEIRMIETSTNVLTPKDEILAILYSLHIAATHFLRISLTYCSLIFL